MNDISPIKHQFSTPAAPSAVFRAIATQAGQQAWWNKQAEVSETVGGDIELAFVKNGQPVNMRFELVERSAQRVAWHCTTNDNPAWVGSTLVWEIEPEGEGSVVRFTHAGFAMGGPPYEGTREGWPRFMESLQQVVVDQPGNPL